MVRTLLISVSAVMAVPAAAFAQPIAYEGFDYAAGQTANGLNGGTGWATAWNTASPTQFTVLSGSTSNPTGALATSGNQLRTGQASFNEMTRTTAIDLRAGDVWLSYTARRIDPAGSTPYGGLVIGNDVGSGTTTGRLFVGDPGGSDLWSLERAGGGVGATSNFSVGNPATLVVVHIQFQNNGPETVSLYIDPPLTGSPPGSVSAFLNTLDINPTNGPVTNVAFWSGATVWQFDELRIGSSFADVTPVPEPGLVLVVAAGFAALRLRRR